MTFSKKKYKMASDLTFVEIDKYSKGNKSNKSIWNRGWKMWENQPVGPRVTKGLSNLVVNESHKAIETFVANMLELRKIIQPAYEVIERNKLPNLPENPEKLAEIRLLLDYQLDKCGFDEHKYEDACRYLCVEGSLVYKVAWDMSRKKYSSYEGKVEEKEYFGEDQKIAGIVRDGEKPRIDKEYSLEAKDITEKFDSANFTRKDLRKILIDPKVEEFEKQVSIIEIEDDVALEDVLRKKELYNNLGLLKNKLMEKATDEEKKNGLKVTLYHRWGKFDPNEEGDPIEYEIIVEKETKICILCRVNPYDHGTRPYRMVKFLSKRSSAYGLGIPELMYRAQVELNTNRDQMNHNKILNNAPMFTVSSLMNVKKDQCKLRPFGFIELGPNAKADQIRVNNFLESGIMLEKLLKDDFHTTTGATMQIQGTGPGADTLGQSEMLLRQGLHKMSTILARVDREMLQETYRLFYQLTIQYMTVDQEVLIMGAAGTVTRSISRVRIFADVDFIPNGAKYIRQNVLQKQNDIQLLQITSQIPWATPFAKRLLGEIAKGSGREELWREAMEEAKQLGLGGPGGGEGGESGTVAQGNAGLTPQANAAPDGTTIQRQAGSPARNQHS